MKTLFTLILLITSSFRPGCLQMDLLIIGDFSGSVLGKEKFVSSAVYSFVDKLDIDENLQVGLVTFNDYATVVRPLCSNKDTLKSGALAIGSLVAQGNTFLSHPLRSALGEFLATGNVKHKKMIILITDGFIDDLYDADLLIAKFKKYGINFCGVMISNSYSRPEFFKTTCGECYVESSYENLIEQLRKLDVCL